MKITYDGGQIIPELEKAINKTMNDMGFRFYASGMALETGIRDLCFDPPSETTTAQSLTPNQ